MIQVAVLLIIACVWLFADRNSLTEQVTSLEAKVEKARREKTDLEIKLNALQTHAVADPVPVRKTWLQEQIETNHALSKLETTDRRVSPAPVNASPTPIRAVRPNYYGQTNTTVVTNNSTTINVAPRPYRPTPPPPVRYIERR